MREKIICFMYSNIAPGLGIVKKFFVLELFELLMQVFISKKFNELFVFK